MKFTALLHHLTADLLREGYPFNSNVVTFLFASSELEMVWGTNSVCRSSAGWRS